MPLDPYSSSDLLLADYATNLLAQKCMTERGHNPPPPILRVNVQGGASDTTNESHRRVFNMAVAQRWGYHTAPNPRIDIASRDRVHAYTFTTQEDSDWKVCTTRAQSSIQEPRASENLVSSLGMGAYSGALADPMVTAAAKKWATCMAPQGISDLPASPLDMPTPSLTERFQLGRGDLPGGGVDLGTASPSAAEVNLAVADEKCREDSGYRQALYDAEWKRQEAAIRENAPALADAGRKLDAFNARVRQIVGENDH